ncbi:hypothetical protein [Antarctobacter jejuensis]|uniref:hypothetical protein n=1 Tax=Antarctobacter jejuensis TaxID=1439938 RepID=UPI003FD5023E
MAATAAAQRLAGWRMWHKDENLLMVYGGSGWVGTTPDTHQNLALLRLSATAVSSNPFAAKLNAALWTAKRKPWLKPRRRGQQGC